MNAVQTHQFGVEEEAREAAERERTVSPKRRKFEAERRDALRAADVMVGRISGRAEGERCLLGRTTPAQRRRAALALPRPTARDLEVEEGARFVDDPFQPGAKEAVTVNRRVDILEIERAGKRITEGEFGVGRQLQTVFEAAGRIGSSSNWLSGAGPVTAERKDARIVRDVVAAKAADDAMARLSARMGRTLAEVFRKLLLAPGYKAHLGMLASDRQVAATAERFRTLLSIAADEFAAVGPDRGRFGASADEEEMAARGR